MTGDILIITEPGTSEPVAHLYAEAEEFPDPDMKALCGYRWTKDWSAHYLMRWELDMKEICGLCAEVVRKNDAAQEEAAR